MGLVELYLLHRTGAERVQQHAPTSASRAFAEAQQRRGVYEALEATSPDVLTARVDRQRVEELVAAQPR